MIVFYVASHIVVALLCCTTMINCKTFNLGVLFPWKGFWGVGSHSAGAVTIALEQIKSNDMQFSSIKSSGHEFNISWADTGCATQYGLPLLSNMFFGRAGYPKVDAFIGPICSVICEPGGHLVNDWSVPMISFGSTSGMMSDKSLYPTFARTSAPLQFTAPLFVEILKYFGYKRVAIFATYEPVWNTAASVIRTTLRSNGIRVTDYLTFQKSNIRVNLAEVKRYCKGK